LKHAGRGEDYGRGDERKGNDSQVVGSTAMTAGSLEKNRMSGSANHWQSRVVKNMAEQAMVKAA